MIELINIKKTFNAGRPNEFSAINGVSLSIEANKVTVFKGPSGSGKTTLLSIIGCMTRPTSGRIMLADREVTSLPERFLTGIRRKTFGFIFQQFNLIKGITALENVMLPMRFVGQPARAVREKAEYLLESVGLADRRSHLPLQLSGGEQQRVAIARALGNDPALVLADEPTGNLDTRTGDEMAELFLRLNREHGQTFVVVSHDLKLAGHADRVFHMQDGRILKVTSRSGES